MEREEGKTRKKSQYADNTVYMLDPERGEMKYLGRVDEDGIVYVFDNKYGYKKYIGTVDENGIVCVKDPVLRARKYIVAQES